GKKTAKQIAQTSASFSGTLVAIDVAERTIKAKGLFETRKFNLTQDCAIILDGHGGRPMRTLKPGDRLAFNYDQVNGINVVNRIATAQLTLDVAAARPAH